MTNLEWGRNECVTQLTEQEKLSTETKDDLHELCNLFNLDTEKDPSVMQFLETIKQETKHEVNDLLAEVDALPHEPELRDTLASETLFAQVEHLMAA